MSTYVLIPGAGGDSSYWHLVEPLLRDLGHDVVAPDLPADDDTAGFDRYRDVVVDAIGDRRDLILVAQSLGGFTAPLVCERLPVDLVVLVAAMTPKPGESAGDWWMNTGAVDARRAMAEREDRDIDGEFDVIGEFMNGVPPDVVADAMARPERGQSDRVFADPFPLAAWPDVPTRFLLPRDDRFFPADFQRRIVQDRLGITPDEIDGGHLPALGQPHALVDYLERCRAAL